MATRKLSTEEPSNAGTFMPKTWLKQPYFHLHLQSSIIELNLPLESGTRVIGGLASDTSFLSFIFPSGRSDEEGAVVVSRYI